MTEHRGLLNPPSQRSNTIPVLMILAVGFTIAGIFGLANWGKDAVADAGREQAQAVQAIATERPSDTPTSTPNWLRETVTGGEATAVYLDILNSSAAGTLQVEESNQRQRQAQQLQDVRLTQESVLHTFAITSTQQANVMSINAKLAENETARQVAIEEHQTKLVLWIIGFAAGVGLVMAVIVWIGRLVEPLIVSLVDYLRSLWEEAGEPEPAQPAVYEIHSDGNIRRPLAGDVCTDEQLEIIAGVVQGAKGLTVEALENAGMPSEDWIDTYREGKLVRIGIRSRMIDRGLLEVKNTQAKRKRVVPTADGWALFNDVASAEN